MHQYLQKNLGQFISLRRKELGLSQQQLAKELNMSRSHIAKIELGDSLPPLKTLISLNAVLQINLLDPKLIQLEKAGIDQEEYNKMIADSNIQPLLLESSTNGNIIHVDGQIITITIERNEVTEVKTIKIVIT